MNEKQEENDKDEGTSEENVFLPNISGDSNANRNETLKHITKSIERKSIVNGVADGRAKVNNNVLEPDVKNGVSNLKDKVLQNNVNGKAYEKPCPVNNFDALGANGFKFNKQTYENGVSREVNGSSSSSEPGPSTSSQMPLVLSNHSIWGVDSDEYSSDTGNDELSCCDDCCIYTYKGDIADLPRSFLNMDHQDNAEGQAESRAGSRGSSPEMDFLEMDFDPGPSCDAESDESSANLELKDDGQRDNFNYNDSKPCCSTSDLQKKDVQEVPNSSNFPEQYEISDEPQPCCSKSESQPCTNKAIQNNLSQKNLPSMPKNCDERNVPTNKQILNSLLPEELMNLPWIPKNLSERTVASTIVPDSKGHHSSSGDLISWTTETPPPSTINTSSSLYHSTMEKKLVLDKQPSGVVHSFIEKTMIWTEQEAALKQVTQISTSACGATAVINVLQALNHQLPSNEKIIESVTTRLRANSATLVKYLKSRSVAGSTHRDLIVGLNKLTSGKVYARFFHMHPERYINLSQWLSYWIKKGAVPIATLNLQRGVGCGGLIPDAWHHQMIFGVGPLGIYLTNPLERVEEGLLWHQLCSDSTLSVRREDVISRFDFKTSLKELMAIKDVRWLRHNVVGEYLFLYISNSFLLCCLYFSGQTANVVREHRLKCSTLSRTHVCVPAAYEAGITLAMNVSNPACELLKSSPELPILGTLP